MKIKTLIASLAAFTAALVGTSSHGAILFDNTTWYAAGASATLTNNDGALAMSTGGAGNFALTYLTPSGTYNSITVGQSLTMTVNFTLTGTIGAASTGLRFGLLNSGGSRISADGVGQSSTTYANYSGYAAVFGDNSLTTNGLSTALWERGTGNALINSSGTYTSRASGSTNIVSGGSPVTPAMASNTDYTLALTLNYISAGNLSVTSTLTGGLLPSGGIIRSFTDTDSLVTSFDTVVLFTSNGIAPGIEFNSVAVPEPSTIGSLLASAVLGVVVCIWRRRPAHA